MPKLELVLSVSGRKSFKHSSAKKDANLISPHVINI